MAKKILLIDDDEQLRNACRDYLAECGYEVDCAQELEEAQSLMTFVPYSVVVTDLRLSKLAFGGLEVIRHIRERALPARVVVLTAYGWPELKTEASASGVDAFLRKPAKLRELGAAVNALTGAAA
ncbi:MAG TPA: response regulator [Candidatus Aquilonibacter sp.]|nr:response regulator [Candidatus Aquilonibacter sp.]